MKYFLISFIKIYRVLISPILPDSCRFHPTCSEYFIEALEIHGTIKGSLLGIKRILRCNPFCKCGYDPVPIKNDSEFSFDKHN